MPTNNNSAYRVYQILYAACKQPGHQKIWQVFAEVFGVRHSNGRKLIAEVNRLLDLFFDEFELAKAQMQATDFSRDLYQGAFIAIEQHLSLDFMYNDWQGQKQAIQPALHSLKFCSEVLPHEVDFIEVDNLKLIEEAVDELRTRLQDSDLPSDVKAFIQGHIHIIEKALRDYQIIGAKAFKSAMYEGYVHSAENADIITEYEDTKEMGLLGKAWGGVKKAASVTLGNEKVLTAGTKLAELGMKIAEHIDKTHHS